MASQYKKIKDYDDVLWGYTSPVSVERMRLCYNTLYGVNVLQITFRNVCPQNIYGLSISVSLFDARGEKIYKDVDFNYYAMQIPSGKTFGASEDIVVESEAVAFEVTVKGADLNNGRRYHSKVLLEKMPKPTPLSMLRNLEEPYIAKFGEKYPKTSIVCLPEQHQDYWTCSCGKLWPDDLIVCPECGVEKEVILELLPAVKQDEKDRKAAEAARLAEERRLAEEEARIADEARMEAKRRREEEIARREAEDADMLANAEEARQAAIKAKRKKIKRYTSLAITFICLCLFIFVLIPVIKSYHASRYDEYESENTSGGAITQPESKQEPVEEEPDEKSGEDPAGAEVETGVKNPDWFTEPILVLGEDLESGQMGEMCKFFGVDESELSSMESRKVSSSQGHIYLDFVIGKNNVEDEALSGIIVIPREESGVDINMYNISYYNESAFAAQLRTMGIMNADVVVAAPKYSSGSSAMVGLMLSDATISNDLGPVIGKAVARRNMNVRSGASVDSARYATIPIGTEVEVLEIGKNLWYKIVWPGSELGYAYTSNFLNEYYTYTDLTK